MDGFLGTEQDVLLEEKHDGVLKGYTDRYIRVRAHMDDAFAGRCVKLLLRDRNDDIMTGVIREGERRGPV
jgi:hypothetical protein